MSSVAFAEGEQILPDCIDYVKEDGTKGHLDRSEFKIYGLESPWYGPMDSGWYVVIAGGSIDKRLEVAGDVKFILMSEYVDDEGDTINAPTLDYLYGIHVPEGTSFSVYSQTADKAKWGKIIATGSDHNAGIGGDCSTKDKAEKCGTINIYGGTTTYIKTIVLGKKYKKIFKKKIVGKKVKVGL